MHPIVKLAKQAIEAYVRSGVQISGPSEDEVTPEMKRRSGVFVSIHTKEGVLRGCIGTFQPTQDNVTQETIRNAISAATRDPRFSPVGADELDDLEISVDVLTPPEPVDSMDELDAAKYGVLVKSGWRRGLLLPDLDGVDTPAQQVDICRRKAGIGPDEPVELYRFEVERHH